MLSFVAAVKVAQWVAKAYGYVALKRREYVDVSTSILGKWVRIFKRIASWGNFFGKIILVTTIFQ